MEFSINPDDIIKCHSIILLRVLPGRNSEGGIYNTRLLSTVQSVIEKTDDPSGNVFREGTQIPGVYLILRFLLPQTFQVDVFEAENEMDLYVGASYETAQIKTLPIFEKIVQEIKRMID